MNNPAVMISIRPEWCKLISDGKKTDEVRKSFPLGVTIPFKCYIYESRERKAVIGEFSCDCIRVIKEPYWDKVAGTCLTAYQMHKYGKGALLYGWRISDLLIYDQPLSIGEFSVLRGTTNWTWVEKLKRPPQSWCYVFEKEVAANDKS